MTAKKTISQLKNEKMTSPVKFRVIMFVFFIAYILNSLVKLALLPILLIPGLNKRYDQYITNRIMTVQSYFKLLRYVNK